mmetsp:Transcript_104853/g.293906  ORF Transcript_104853/g.293906 Transcript_104853/m.293906 type:complete len:247 (+) Transcript_104853:756-1496(+)
MPRKSAKRKRRLSCNSSTVDNVLSKTIPALGRTPLCNKAARTCPPSMAPSPRRSSSVNKRRNWASSPKCLAATCFGNWASWAARCSTARVNSIRSWSKALANSRKPLKSTLPSTSFTRSYNFRKSRSNAAKYPCMAPCALGCASLRNAFRHEASLRRPEFVGSYVAKMRCSFGERISWRRCSACGTTWKVKSKKLIETHTCASFSNSPMASFSSRVLPRKPSSAKAIRTPDESNFALPFVSPLANA